MKHPFLLAPAIALALLLTSCVSPAIPGGGSDPPPASEASQAPDGGWPEDGLAAQLPNPGWKDLTVVSPGDQPDYFLASFLNVSAGQAEAYAQRLRDAGFTDDEFTSEEDSAYFFEAKNKAGYRASVSCEKNGYGCVSLNVPSYE